MEKKNDSKEEKKSEVGSNLDDSFTADTKIVNAEEIVEFTPTANFKPVIPLPPLIDVSLLHADENVIYETRAKLYQLTREEEANEWADRGVGPIKILQHKATKKVRIVMWRDQVNSVAANHCISGIQGIKYLGDRNNGQTMLIWGCVDYTFEYPKNEIFLSKFRSPETCLEFKKHVDHFISLIESEDDKENENKSDENDEEEDLTKSIAELAVADDAKVPTESNAKAEEEKATKVEKEA